MKALWISLAVLVAVAGSVLALVTGGDRAPRGAEAPEAPAPRAADVASTEALTPDPVRLASPETAPEDEEARTSVRPEDAETKEGKGSAAASKDDDARPTEAEMAEFHAYVAEALDEVRSTEARKRRRVVEGHRDMLEDLLPRFTEDLDLDAATADLLRDALRADLDRESEYVWLYESGAEDDELAELRKTDREATESRLREFLEPRQLPAVLDWVRRAR